MHFYISVSDWGNEDEPVYLYPSFQAGYHSISQYINIHIILLWDGRFLTDCLKNVPVFGLEHGVIQPTVQYHCVHLVLNSTLSFIFCLSFPPGNREREGSSLTVTFVQSFHFLFLSFFLNQNWHLSIQLTKPIIIIIITTNTAQIIFQFVIWLQFKQVLFVIVDNEWGEKPGSCQRLYEFPH